MPRVEEGWKDIGRQSVQVITWLVGLSVGIIALIITNKTNVEYLNPGSAIAVLILLSIVIVSGATHRVLYLYAETLLLPVLTGLYGYLAGYTNPIEEPCELEEYWDRDEIVRRLKEDFEADYSFLVERNVPLEGCREAYNSLYRIYKKIEQESVQEFLNVLAAYLGYTKEEEKKFLSPSDIASLTAHAKKMRRAFYASTIFYYIASAFFVAAMLVVTGNSIYTFL